MPGISSEAQKSRRELRVERDADEVDASMLTSHLTRGTHHELGRASASCRTHGTQDAIGSVCDS